MPRGPFQRRMPSDDTGTTNKKVPNETSLAYHDSSYVPADAVLQRNTYLAICCANFRPQVKRNCEAEMTEAARAAIV